MTEPERLAPVSFDAYPGLFQGADVAAVSLRSRHYGGEALLLVLNPVSAGLALLVTLGAVRLPGAVFTAISTMLMVLALWVTRAAHWQHKWYECRSVAEDLKRLTWRYLMQLEPFTADEKAPDAAFVSAANGILHRYPGVLTIVGRRDHTPSPPVTPEMRRVRQSSVEERAELFLTSRLRPEVAWYAAKARRLGTADRRWFAALIFVQVAAVASALILAFRVLRGTWSPAEDGWVVMLTAVGTSMIGWQRSKRFSDLESSYAATAHALAGMESARPQPSESGPYVKWLERVEATLAQEHEAWRHMT